MRRKGLLPSGLKLVFVMLFSMTFSLPAYAQEPLDLMKLLGIKKPKTSGESMLPPEPAGPSYDEVASLLSKKKDEPSRIELEYRERLEKQNLFPLSRVKGEEDQKTPLLLMEESARSNMGGETRPSEPFGAKTKSQGKGRTLPDSSARKGVSGKQMSQGGKSEGLPEENQSQMGKAQTPGSETRLVQVSPLTKQKREIQAQLLDLEGVEDERAAGLIKKLEQQLMDLTALEAEANNRQIAELKVAENEKDRENSIKKLQMEAIRKGKPLLISATISQYGYDLFRPLIPPPSPHQTMDMPVLDDYLIGPGDGIVITYSGGVNDSQEYQVGRDGTINLFGEKPVNVSGLTFSKMSSLIKRIVEEKMIGVSVNIRLGEFRMNRIFVLGDAETPGVCLVSGVSNISSTLIACGGVKKIGSLRNVQLIRKGRKVSSFDTYDFLLRGDTSKDIYIQGGDAILIPPIQDTIAVAGEVNRPAIYELGGKMTLEEVISMAGGLRPTSMSQYAQIERLDSRGMTSVIDVDLKTAARGMVMQNGDIVKIFSSLRIEERENVLYVLGNVKRPGKRAFSSGMHLRDVLPGLEELLPQSYLEYGIIERENRETRDDSVVRFNISKVFSGEENPELMPGDRIYIFNRSQLQEPKAVEVAGSVRTPGKFEFKEGMRVNDLILLSGGLEREADRQAAELYRTDRVTREVTIIRVNLGNALSMKESDNVLLADLDRLVVHSAWEQKVPDTVTIEGEVNKPGVYPLAKNATVLDVVFAAGGLTEKAYRKAVEVTRYSIENNEQRVSRRLTLDLDAVIGGGSSAEIVPLEPNDRVYIRQIRNWDGDFSVTISGEVLFPGKYRVIAGETLSGLIARAGGLTSDAFPLGTRFTRRSVAVLQEKQFKDLADKLELDSMRLAASTAGIGGEKSIEKQQLVVGSIQRIVEKLRSTVPEGRLVVNLTSLERLKGSESDLELQNGDALHIPRRPDALLVMGEVYNPNAFTFSNKKSVKDYLNLAGGYTDNANSEGTYIIKVNGEVIPLKQGFFRSVRIGPGDVIMVPEKIERFSGLEAAKDISQILYQLAITGASFKTLNIIK